MLAGAVWLKWLFIMHNTWLFKKYLFRANSYSVAQKIRTIFSFSTKNINGVQETFHSINVENNFAA